MENYFIANALKESINKMCKKFGVSDSVCNAVYKKHNIIVPKELKNKWQVENKLNPYCEAENKYIKANIETKSIKQIAKEIGRSSTTLQKHVHILGLTEIIEIKKKKSYFKKGHISANKGMKQVDYMTPEMIERTKATRFKKGQEPHNAFKDFEEVIRQDKRKNGRKYILIKLPGNKKLVYKHIHVWETENKTKLKRGFNIVFKDGNTQNLEIENLECISDAELLNRNTLHRYPKEIIELIQMKAAITRQINKHKKQKP